jgi:hypothetical protein
MYTEYSSYPGEQFQAMDNSDHEDFRSKSKSNSSSRPKPSTPKPAAGSTTIVQTTTRTGGGGYGYRYGVPIIATTPIVATTDGGTVVYTRGSSMYGWIFGIVFVVAIIALVYFFGNFDGDDTVTTTTIIRNGGNNISRGLSKLSKSARYLRR